MRLSESFRIVIACAVAATLAAGLATYAAEPAAKQAEPPLEFTLEVDGKPVELVADRAVKISVGGKDAQATLRVKPTRLLDTPELSFRYPRNHAFQYEHDEATTTWTLDGNDSVVILTRYAAKAAPADIAPALIEQISKQLGGPKQSPVTLDLFGKSIAGTQLLATVAGQQIVQSIYAFDAGGATYSIVVQDSGGDAAPTDETKDVLALLKSTAKLK